MGCAKNDMDGNICWLNGDDELCYMNTKGKKEKIASGVNSFSFNRYSITMKSEDRTGYMFLKKTGLLKMITAIFSRKEKR